MARHTGRCATSAAASSIHSSTRRGSLVQGTKSAVCSKSGSTRSTSQQRNKHQHPGSANASKLAKSSSETHPIAVIHQQGYPVDSSLLLNRRIASDVHTKLRVLRTNLSIGGLRQPQNLLLQALHPVCICPLSTFDQGSLVLALSLLRSLALSRRACRSAAGMVRRRICASPPPPLFELCATRPPYQGVRDFNVNARVTAISISTAAAETVRPGRVSPLPLPHSFSAW